MLQKSTRRGTLSAMSEHHSQPRVARTSDTIIGPAKWFAAGGITIGAAVGLVFAFMNASPRALPPLLNTQSVALAPTDTQPSALPHTPAAPIAYAQVAVFAVFLLIGRPELYLLLWLLPWMTSWRVVNRLRAIAEHGGMEASRATTPFCTFSSKNFRSRSFWSPATFCQPGFLPSGSVSMRSIS